MRRIITLLLLALVATACTGGGDTVDLEQGAVAGAAAAEHGKLTPFGERLYGSAWIVFQSQTDGDTQLDHGNPSRLGGFSFYGSRTALSVSVNHTCGSATAPVEVSDDRIVPIGFVIPTGCEDLAVFTLFTQPKIAAAFNDGHLELTGNGASLIAQHFISVSENGTAPLYAVGDPYIRYQSWRSDEPRLSHHSAQSFTIHVFDPDSHCTEASGVVLEPEIQYEPDVIRIAAPAAAGLDLELDLGIVNRLAICYGPTAVAITLDEPRDGRPVAVWHRPTRPATAEEIAAATERFHANR